MISKSLFFKLVKQDFKNRIWYPLITFIAFFLVFEVLLLMMIENIQKFPKLHHYDVHTYVRDYFFGAGSLPDIIAVCAAAFIAAISGYAYLHSKAQVDVCHSLPVSRSQLFWARYLSGILQFFIPFLIHMLICVGIIAAKGAFAMDIISAMLTFTGLLLLIFILVYSVSVLAVGLTGNIIVSILGAGVLFGYSMVIAVLAYMLSDRFFHTYVVYGNRIGYPVSDIIWCFSPFSMIAKLFASPGNTKMGAAGKLYQYDASYVWVLAAAAVVYSLSAYIVYRKRASEAAGKPIAFRAAEPVIKTMVVIPAALFSGELFSEISSGTDADNWFLFGVIFSFVILCILMEIIFRLDIRGALTHKKQFLFNAACTALIVVVFRYDVTGYDTYVPADSELKSCAVNIEQLIPLTQTVSLNDGWFYLSSGDYRMANMEIQGNPSVMTLARKAAKEKLDYRIFDYYEGIEQSPEYIETRNRESNYRQVSFGYKLLNGKTIYREYIVDITDADTLKLLSDIFADYDYKLGSTPVFNDSWEIAFDAVKCTSNFKRKDIMLTPQMQSELIAAYHKEYTGLTLDTVMNVVPAGTIDFVTQNKLGATGREYTSYSGSMYVYPQFTETLALLKGYGFDMEEKLTADEVESVTVTETYDHSNDAYYSGSYSGYGSYGLTSVSVETADTNETEYTDKEQIQQILDNVVNDGFSWPICSYAAFFDKNYTINIRSEADGVTYSCHSFIAGRIPDFIR